MREKNHSRNYLLTIDKLSTWNQGPIAQSFGVDTIIAYHDFKLTEAFGTHKRTGDGSFFAQCQEKIEKGEIWKKGENAYMQLITLFRPCSIHIAGTLKRSFILFQHSGKNG